MSDPCPATKFLILKKCTSPAKLATNSMEIATGLVISGPSYPAWRRGAGWPNRGRL